MEYRKEIDSMGEVSVPENAYYGAQTLRAVGNFPISGLRFPSSFLNALALIKKHAAIVNLELGLLETDLSNAIVRASDEIMNGTLDDQFVVDVFQTGSGTSSNMNTNEVIAGRANEILTGKRGGKTPVHPNDHVNLGQSSNDVIPSAIHISTLQEIENNLLASLEVLFTALDEKAREFGSIKKLGRTHLQDAVPMTLGQEFSGYAHQIEKAVKRIKRALPDLSRLALGGTALGTGINTHPDFAKRVIAGISKEIAVNFKETENHFEAQAAQDTSLDISNALKTLAVALSKIANDIRWLSSGPRCGLGEINIPSLQPGSSIMPGKVNPVIPEAVIQVAAQVIGNDITITMAGQAGVFELNTMLPVIAYNLLQSIGLLDNAITVFTEKCITGITPNIEKCSSNLEQSLALATALVPVIGYDKAADIAETAHKTGKTIRETAIESGVLPEREINRILDKITTGM